MKSVRAFFCAIIMFIKVLLSYKESVVENELTIGQAWLLCRALQEARFSKGRPFRVSPKGREK